MQNGALDFLNSDSESRALSRLKSAEAEIPLPLLRQWSEDWLFDAEIARQSKVTIAGKRDTIKKLLWFCGKRGRIVCGARELRGFFAYVVNGHLEEGGRWGNPHMTHATKARTSAAYFVYLQGFFRYCVREELIEVSPLARIDKPIARAPKIIPFSADQVTALIASSQQAKHPERDEALIRMLLDTGLRAAETASLRVGDIDQLARRTEVLGKGDKRRQIYFGKNTSRALRHWIRTAGLMPEHPLFISYGGHTRGETLTRRGVHDIVSDTGKRAGLQGVRCSPHTFRHTFAIEFLRNGGNVFSLMEILGHSDLKMTDRYVRFAESDIENQHRRFAPGDRF